LIFQIFEIITPTVRKFLENSARNGRSRSNNRRCFEDWKEVNFFRNFIEFSQKKNARGLEDRFRHDGQLDEYFLLDFRIENCFYQNFERSLLPFTPSKTNFFQREIFHVGRRFFRQKKWQSRGSSYARVGNYYRLCGPIRPTKKIGEGVARGTNESIFCSTQGRNFPGSF
jgi:hypothetical protein